MLKTSIITFALTLMLASTVVFAEPAAAPAAAGAVKAPVAVAPVSAKRQATLDAVKACREANPGKENRAAFKACIKKKAPKQ